MTPEWFKEKPQQMVKLNQPRCKIQSPRRILFHLDPQAIPLAAHNFLVVLC